MFPVHFMKTTIFQKTTTTIKVGFSTKTGFFVSKYRIDLTTLAKIKETSFGKH